MTTHYDVIVIGAGPGGYVAAIRCAQLGLKTACVDRGLDADGKPVLGGTCLNVGCIPSKALLDVSHRYIDMRENGHNYGLLGDMQVDVSRMLSYKARVVRQLTGGIKQLLKANDIDWLQGEGKLLNAEREVQVTAHDGQQTTHSAKTVIIATGSKPRELAIAPLKDRLIIDSTGALTLDSVPQKLGIIGAGVIGLELGSVWSRVGSEVTIFEAQERFLPTVDQEIAKAAQKVLREQKLDLLLGAGISAINIVAGKVEVVYRHADSEHRKQFDRLIVATGRVPVTDNLCDKDLLKIDDRGYIAIDDDCQTNIPGVYAIGDVVRGAMLAHKASEEGIAVAERIAGHYAKVNYDAIPWVIYTHPEIAWVGKTEEMLKESGEDYKTGVFPMAASGRARAMHASAGMIKIISSVKSDRVLGVHILSAQASELIAQAVLALEFEATTEDIARTIFAHPTLSEALHEAALSVDKRALHITNK